MNIEEFEIPMPWGHIAAKAWGNKENKPILVTHGRLDNAASFDRLIPLLPNSFYYICIDLPSHGKSTFFPPYLPIFTMHFVLIYKMILNYFKRDKYILLAHSYGGIIGNLIARFYPDCVEKLISIDNVVAYIPAVMFKDHITHVFSLTTKYLEKQRKIDERTYTEEEALDKVSKGRWSGPLPTNVVKPLAMRMLKPAGNGKYHLISDLRMLEPVYPLHDINYVIDSIHLYPIHCPYLLIMCKKSKAILFAEEAIEEYKKYPNFTLQWVNATHDVHIESPEMIAGYISDFLMKSTAQL